ncbi:MAG TPA: glycosyltransferase [Rhizomicrobium sp.]|nr:glycosyltransferase [Rhizomicrobium sp.]
MFAAIFGVLPLCMWIYLIAARGMFWLARERDEVCPFDGPWPSVAAIVPARDEADVIARSISSLLAQDYPGRFDIILVDDQSDDGTASVARALDASGRLQVLNGAPRPPGWTGKLWAVKQGIEKAGATDYLWLTDADIAHTPDDLRNLAARARLDDLVLVSSMAKLNCETFAERLLIPAFVFFFAMLFPFAWVNRKTSRVAAAAGGCMLVSRAALEKAGGIDMIRHEIIDDCALARLMKKQGGIRLALTERSISLRPYERIEDIRRMVARSAYPQLDYSLLLLAGTLIGVGLLCVAAPIAAIFGSGLARITGVLAWLLLALAMRPMLRFYRLSPLWGFALPVTGALYALFTLDSAIQFWRGRGGMWKGRAQAMRA